MDPCLYICHPCEQIIPTLGQTLDEFRAGVLGIDDWKHWSLVCLPLDRSGSLTTRDLSSRVLSRKGPVLLINPVRQKVVADIRLKLEGTISIHVADAWDLPSLQACAEIARAAHINGEPRFSRNKVVALLLMRKLERERMWAGNDKSYMWRDDLPKGRGVDEKFAAVVPNVTNMLLQHGLLVSKRSMSKNKYALNPARKTEIHDILRSKSFTGDLAEAFARDKMDESVRELDLLDEYLVEDSLDAPS